MSFWESKTLALQLQVLEQRGPLLFRPLKLRSNPHVIEI